uniref:Putative secreted protein n=1 Tax=Panstrongylus lignarius TaxID=156445 RepID=A0A224Y6E7_9HEMI
MRVILSPFIIILPSDLLFFVFILYSSASSNTKFMYSSKPTMCPSILRLIFSYNHTHTRDLFCKYLKIRFIG